MRPTRIRYIILGMTTLVAVMLYLDRWCLGFVAPHIGDQLRLKQSEIDLLQATFFVSYAFGQLPCGWLADRFGPRAMLTLYLFTWSVLTGMMGLATTLWALMLFRLGCGLFEAGAYPAAAGLVRRWMPFHQRGLGSAFVSIGGRIGGAIAFPLSAYLMVAFATRSHSPEFSVRDIVDPSAIAKQLIDPEASERGSFAQHLAQHVRPWLSSEQVELLRTLAKGGPSNEAASRVADVLNDLLRRPDLVAGLDLTPYRDKIPPEAWGNSEVARTSLSTRDLEVRNRLLLEVALPRLVCKLYGWGWQPTLFVFGMTGVGLAVVFWAFFRNGPRQHPLVNTAEAELIEAAPPTVQATGHVPPPAAADAGAHGGLWRGILSSRSLWLCSAVQFGVNFGWVFLGTKMPEYLERVHQVPTIEQGWMVFLPFLLSVPMTMIGGGWTDWMTRRWGAWLGRAFPIGSTRFAAAAAFLVCVLLDAPWPITLAFCAVSVASDLGLPAIWAYNLDVGGRNVGLILGWGNMWGNLGAAASPYVLGRIQEHYGWNAVFITCAAVFIVIGIASFGIDATKPIAARPSQ